MTIWTLFSFCVGLLQINAAISLVLPLPFNSSIIQASNLTANPYLFNPGEYRSLIGDGIERIHQTWPDGQLYSISGFGESLMPRKALQSPSDVKSLSTYWCTPADKHIVYHRWVEEIEGTPTWTGDPPWSAGGGWENPPPPRSLRWPARYDFWSAYDMTRRLSQGQLREFETVTHKLRLFPEPVGWIEVFTFEVRDFSRPGKAYKRPTLHADKGTLVDYLTGLPYRVEPGTTAQFSPANAQDP